MEQNHNVFFNGEDKEKKNRKKGKLHDQDHFLFLRTHCKG
jgi:ribosome-associated protein YbcJ (S4-like RNA binding protein)